MNEKMMQIIRMDLETIILDEEGRDLGHDIKKIK